MFQKRTARRAGRRGEASRLLPLPGGDFRQTAKRYRRLKRRFYLTVFLPAVIAAVAVRAAEEYFKLKRMQIRAAAEGAGKEIHPKETGMEKSPDPARPSSGGREEKPLQVPFTPCFVTPQPAGSRILSSGKDKGEANKG